MSALQKTRSSVFAVLSCLLVLSGCSDPGFQIAKTVEGSITLKGQPLEKVRVEFWPLSNGPQSAALTDDQGRFVLSTLDGLETGAVIGKHKVVLRDMSIIKVPFRGRANEDVDMTGGEKPRIAAKYTNATTTPLEIEIKGDRKDIAFDVEPRR